MLLRLVLSRGLSTHSAQPPISPRSLAFKAVGRLKELTAKGRFGEVAGLFGKLPPEIVAGLGRLSSSVPIKSGNFTKTSDILNDTNSEAIIESDMKSVRPLPSDVLRRVEVWNALIDSIADRGDSRLAYSVFRHMRERVAPSGESFTSLLNACANDITRNGEDSAEYPHNLSLRIFYRLLERGTVERIHVNALLKCCSRAGDWQTMFEVFGQLNLPDSEARGKTRLPLGDFVEKLRAKAAAASAVEEESITANAEEEQKQEQDVLSLIRPDKITYYTMISACARRRGNAAYDDAMVVWKMLLSESQFSHDLEGDVTGKLTFTEEEYREWMKAESVAREVDKDLAHVRPDTEIINAMLLVCKNSDTAGRVRMTYEIAYNNFGKYMDFKEFAESVRAHDKKQYRRLSSMLINCKLDKIEGLPRFVPNAKSVSIVSDVMTKGLFPPDFILRFLDYAKEFVKEDAYIIATRARLSMLNNKPDIVKRLMIAHRRKSTPTLYEVALEACYKTKDFPLAKDLWEESVDMANRKLFIEGSRFIPTKTAFIYYYRSAFVTRNYDEVLNAFRFIIEAEPGSWRFHLAHESKDREAFWELADQSARALLKLETDKERIKMLLDAKKNVQLGLQKLKHPIKTAPHLRSYVLRENRYVAKPEEKPVPPVGLTKKQRKALKKERKKAMRKAKREKEQLKQEKILAAAAAWAAKQNPLEDKTC